VALEPIWVGHGCIKPSTYKKRPSKNHQKEAISRDSNIISALLSINRRMSKIIRDHLLLLISSMKKQSILTPANNIYAKNNN
jgi:hypothetical protein